MTELNLVANTPEQEKVKSYLEANASEMLALKINTGTKTLVTFMAMGKDLPLEPPERNTVLLTP